MSASRNCAAYRRALGVAVRAERQRLGWSQETLAEKAELARAYVTELEGGRRTPNLATILGLASAFGMKPSKLMAMAEAPAGSRPLR